jgi:uncharacterized damage-inducible protein DinB
MAEVKRLVKEMQDAFHGPSWHGPAVLEALKDVDAKMASARPIKNGHTIWELVLHMACWKDVGRWRLEGNDHIPTDEENFPSVSNRSDAAWERAQQTLITAHEKLVKAVEGATANKLEECFPEGPLSHFTRLYGVIHHDLYHTGQIALLKKMHSA